MVADDSGLTFRSQVYLKTLIYEGVRSARQECVKKRASQPGFAGATGRLRFRLRSRLRPSEAGCHAPRNEGVPGSSPGVGFSGLQ
jgi:hypothetical protein